MQGQYRWVLRVPARNSAREVQGARLAGEANWGEWTENSATSLDSAWRAEPPTPPNTPIGDNERPAEAMQLIVVPQKISVLQRIFRALKNIVAEWWLPSKRFT